MKVLVFLLFGVVLALPCDLQGASGDTIQWNDEIVYHVMPRSFRDSNGDGHGDFRGMAEGLDYLQELGVTVVLLAPVYASDFYHNYFPTDYGEIDPEYGTKADWFALARALHARGMKLVLDMETQYAQSGNDWFDDSYRNPGSGYSDFIYYSDEANEVPEQFYIPSGSALTPFRAWPDGEHLIVHLDMNHPTVLQYMKDYYAWWADPNGDGDFDDGVDGFRIDHIMDDLDGKGLFTNLYEDFWRPVFDAARAVNPKLFIVGEQADWGSDGLDMIERSGADASFNFPRLWAFAALVPEGGITDLEREPSEPVSGISPAPIHEAVLTDVKKFTGPPWSLHFIENHDMSRAASDVNGHPGLLHAAATLMLTLPGVPSIYYGQELGLPGNQVPDVDYDANHIPIREAFPWSVDPNAPEVAVWYDDGGPWWKQSIYNSEVIHELALPAQQANEASLWHHYRDLIALRKAQPALRRGSYEPVDTGSTGLMGFRRSHDGETLLVLINLSGTDQAVPAGLLQGVEDGPLAGRLDRGNLAGWSYAVVRER